MKVLDAGLDAIKSAGHWIYTVAFPKTYEEAKKFITNSCVGPAPQTPMGKNTLQQSGHVWVIGKVISDEEEPPRCALFLKAGGGHQSAYDAAQAAADSECKRYILGFNGLRLDCVPGRMITRVQPVTNVHLAETELHQLLENFRTPFQGVCEVYGRFTEGHMLSEDIVDDVMRTLVGLQDARATFLNALMTPECCAAQQGPAAEHSSPPLLQQQPPQQVQQQQQDYQHCEQQQQQQRQVPPAHARRTKRARTDGMSHSAQQPLRGADLMLAVQPNPLTPSQGASRGMPVTRMPLFRNTAPFLISPSAD